jgi:uncharacterized protein
MDLSRALECAPTGDRPRLSADGSRLCGARCQACRATSWPGRAICHVCGSAEVGDEEFSAHGVLLTYTTVYISRPGLAAPYVLGQVRLDERGPTVFGHLRGLPVDVSLPCRVMVASSGEVGAMPWYWFEPSS